MTDDRKEAAAPPDEDDAASGIARVTERATETAQKVMAWFPVRVWQRFSSRNGSILAAGASYQALFAIFAALYVAFAALGIWLGGSRDAVDRLVSLINGYLPGAIGTEDGQGIISVSQVESVAQQSITTLGITGVVALVVVLYTAISWIGTVRTTVRDIFGLGAEKGNIVLLQVRDALAAASFAILLLLGAVLGWAGTAALSFVFGLFGWPQESPWAAILGRVIAIAVMFGVNTVTLLLMFRFLTGTPLRTKDVLPGSLLGAAGVTVLQLAFGYLIGKTPSNPLLVTFAVLIGLLLWIRLVMMAILLAAAWVAENAAENDISLEQLSPEDRARRDAEELVHSAEQDVVSATDELARSSMWGRPRRRRDLMHAHEVLDRRRRELADLQDAEPPGRGRSGDHVADPQNDAR